MAKKKITEVEPKVNQHLEQQVADLKTEVEILSNKYRRALADFQNLERQVREDQARFVKIATQLFVEQMILPFDHLQLAAKHLNDKGLNLVVGQFRQLFESQGLKEIEALDQNFDPDKMEAVETREGKEGVVLEVLQSGYELNGVVIRPAKVVVGQTK